MNTVTAVLLAWAVHLSGYPAPNEVERATLRVEYHPAEFFHEHACYGKVCNVWGWYRFDHVVYMREECEGRRGLCEEILLHELTHWVQHLNNGTVAEDDCVEFIAREREAYRVQEEYRLQVLGGFPKMGPVMRCGV